MQQIDHEQPSRPPRKKTWIEKAQARDKWLPLSILAVAAGGVLSRNGREAEVSLDFVVFCGFMLLMAWLLWPSSKNDDGQ